MHVISKKALKEFWADHPDAERPLRRWYKTVAESIWRSFAAMRRAFPAADQVERFTVFNIGGNKVRLIAVIHFNRGKIYVRHVLTHKAYDDGDWKGN